MNKSVAVFNLKLPDDLLHYICEFIYYTYDDCIKHQREKKQKVNNIIHNDAEFAINEYMLSFNKAFSIHKYKIQMQMLICKTCNNYKLVGFGCIHKNSMCFCNNDEDIVYRQIDKNTYESWFV